MYSIATLFKTSQNIQLFSFINQSHSINSRQIQTDITCANYFKVMFWEKRFAKNGSFTNFWLMGSRN